MGTTNRAEEYADNKLTPKAKEYAVTSSIRAVYDNCVEDFNAGFNSCQIKIDELTKEVERLRKLITKYATHVSECEGVDFISDSYKDDTFTHGEWKTLQELRPKY